MLKRISWLLIVLLWSSGSALAQNGDAAPWAPLDAKLLGTDTVLATDLPADLQQLDDSERPTEFRRLVVGAAELYNQGNLDGAYTLFTEAVYLARLLNDPRSIAEGMYNLSVVIYHRGQTDRALEFIESYIGEMESYGLVDWYAEGCWISGYWRYELGQFQPAIDYYARALEIYLDTADYANAGMTIGNIGAAYNYLGQFEQALEFFEESYAVCTDTGDLVGAANAQNNIGSAYSNLGQYDLALEHYELARQHFQQLGDLATETSILENISKVNANLGRFPVSLEYLTESLENRTALNDADGRASVLNQMGIVNNYIGDYEAALESYQQALAAATEAGNQRFIGAALMNTGSLYDTLGLYPLALQHYEQALAIWEATDCVSEIGTALSNIGLVYYDLEQCDVALDYFTQALDHARTQNDPRQEGRALNNIALIYDFWGEYEKAIDYYEQSLALKREIGDTVKAGNSLNNIGLAYLGLGQPDLALSYVLQALDTWQAVSDLQAQLIGQNNIGAIHLHQQEYALAVQALEQSMAIAQEQVHQFTWESGMKGGLADDLRNTGNLMVLAQLGLNQPEDAFATAQSSKGVPLLQLLMQSPDLSKDPAVLQALAEYRDAQAALQTAYGELGKLPSDEELLATCTDESGQVDQPRLEALSKQNQQQEQYFQDLIAEQTAISNDRWDYVRAHEPRLVEIVEVQGLTAQQVQASILQPGQVVLEYMVYLDVARYCLPPELIIFCLPYEGDLAVVRQPLPKLPGDQDLDEWVRLQVGLLLGQDRQAAEAAAQELYTLLVAPVADQLPPGTELIICPDRMLFSVPFEALKDAHGQYLLEDHAVRYASSATTLSYLADPGPERNMLVAGLSFTEDDAADPDEVLNKLLAMRGGDTLLSGLLTRESLFPLPSVPAEVCEVAAILGTDYALDETVTKEYLLANLPGCAVVHLATHGFLHETPLYNGLVVTPSAEPPDGQAPADGDGFLTMDEIMSLPLQGCHLVTLSCCHSAQGEVEAGTGVMGLSQAFIYSGARAVLSSLAKVDDQATQQLMVSFYNNWMTGGESKAEALRQAKLALMAEDQFASPLHWAPFVLYGLE